jgi:hypothetical protein
MRLTNDARCRAPLIFVEKNLYNSYKVQSTEILIPKNKITTTDFF